jgi:methanogenic corrinoid protein MtbC1
LDRVCASFAATRVDSNGLALAERKPVDTESAEWFAKLVRTIEGEVVPRLMLALRTNDTAVAKPATDSSGPAVEVGEFVRFLLISDVAEIRLYVEALRARGHALSRLCTDVFTPAARRLGEMWEEDACDFTQVTVALCRLQQVVHQVSWSLPGSAGALRSSSRVLLTVTEKDPHTFGLVVVAEFFRRAGWDVIEDYGGSARQTAGRVREEWFDIVGLSVSTDRRVAAAKTLVRDLRRVSRNPRVAVILGGPLFLRQPRLADDIGAEAVASDGNSAVALACRLLARMAAAESKGAPVS